MADGQSLNVQWPPASGFGAPLDPATLARAKRGEPAALAEIYARYGGACYTLARRIVGDGATAEDIVQDVFVRLFTAIRRFRGDAPFGAWLKRMTANATIDVVRSQRRFRAEPVDEGFTDAGASAELLVDAWSVLSKLTPRARAIVILHEVEGYTHRELAALFGQSESYSKSILSRALKMLGVDEPGTAGDDHDGG